METMVRIPLPSLKTLSLGCNRISRIRSIRKASFPCLDVLYLDGNAITDGEELACMGSKELWRVDIPGKGNVEDVSWVCKLEAHRFCLLCKKGMI